MDKEKRMQVIELLLKYLDGQESLDNILKKGSSIYYENTSTSDHNLLFVLSELNDLHSAYNQEAFSSPYIQYQFTSMLDKLVN